MLNTHNVPGSFVLIFLLHPPNACKRDLISPILQKTEDQGGKRLAQAAQVVNGQFKMQVAGGLMLGTDGSSFVNLQDPRPQGLTPPTLSHPSLCVLSAPQSLTPAEASPPAERNWGSRIQFALTRIFMP